MKNLLDPSAHGLRMTIRMYLLGVKIDNLSLGEALEKIEGFLEGVKKLPHPSPLLEKERGAKQYYIVLPYADFLVQAHEDEEFRKILNQADLSLSDGVGPVLASRIAGQERLGGRVTGIDLIWGLFERFGAKHSVFLYGAKEGVAREAAEKIKVRHPEVKITGTLNGYVNDKEAITAINNSGAEILLVALGMPKQEKWIYNNLIKVPGVKLAIGVGGAFDFISGRIRRAPKFIQKAGLEWLWRLFMQPSQWQKTWRSVIVFGWLILKK